MAEIICFANSFKRRGRCVVGIDRETGQWVRPIGKGPEGAIGNERLIDGQEPEILDVLDIPLGSKADDLGCQPENRLLTSGKWRKIDEITVAEAMQYTAKTGQLLHNNKNKVPLKCFDDISKTSLKSVQLIHVKKARIHDNPWGKKECNFSYCRYRYSLKTTCPEADQYDDARGDFILTISLGGPYRRKPEDERCCYKMVAGIIELD